MLYVSFFRGIDDSRPGEVSDDMSILQVSCFCYILLLLLQLLNIASD